MEEHSTDDWIVIVSYPDVFDPAVDTYSYYGCHPLWLLRVLEICKDGNTLDDIIWHFRWEKDIEKVKKNDDVNSLMKTCEDKPVSRKT